MTPDLIRAGVIDLDAIDRAGLIPDLRDELLAVRREFSNHRKNRTSGDDVRREMLACDLAKMAGLDRSACLDAARDLTSWPTTALNVVRRFAAEARRRGGGN